MKYKHWAVGAWKACVRACARVCKAQWFYEKGFMEDMTTGMSF